MKKSTQLLITLITCIVFNGNAQESQDPSTVSSLENVHFVDFVFSDITGTLKEVSCPVRFYEKNVQAGLRFDGSSVPGCTVITDSDMLLKPDIATLHYVPWTHDEDQSIRIICDVYVDENTPYESDPRYILRKTLDRAHQMGYEFNVGPEIEFFILDNADENDCPKPCDIRGYFDAETDVQFTHFKKHLLNVLYAQNVNVEKIHHEVACGQHEMSLRYGNALNIADQVIIAKHTIKTIAHENDFHATFMPKPFFGANGSAMHVHFSLWDLKNNCNAFYDANDPNHLSETAKYFLAGVLNRAYEMTALFNPTINSYKRLVPGYEAPTNICWGNKNRSALIRIPQIAEDEAAAARAEIRSPDPSSNPYLLFAALLHAGLEGIANKEELAPAVEENLYHCSQQELQEKNISSLPVLLHEAINALKNGTVAHNLLGQNFVSEFLKIKEQEVYNFNTAITDWELKKYK